MITPPAPLSTPPVETTVGNYFVSNYPPFSTWNEEQIPELQEALSSPPAQPDLCLYVHVPFCLERCRYCYFRVYPRRQPQTVDLYIDALLRELETYSPFPALEGRRLKAVYFGGGTPSYLTAEQIRRLLRGLQERMPWKEVLECTFECEPTTATREKLQALKDLGATRVSLGFQSLSDRVLEASGRRARAEDCLRTYRLARKAGFQEINLDLLAGLPDETAETWRETIKTVIGLAPECVTIYQLELTYNSRLFAGVRAGSPAALPSWPTKRQWVGDAFRALEEAGYTIGSGYMAVRDPESWRFAYTVDHFWRGGDLLALGESSFGHFHGVHYQNVDQFVEYIARVKSGRLPIRRACRLSAEEKLHREVVLLLKTGILEVDYFRSKYNVDIREKFEPQFRRLEEEKMLVVENGTVALTRAGLLSVDGLLPGFYLPEHRDIRYT